MSDEVCVAGLDPSLTGFGLALDWANGRYETRRFSTRPGSGLIGRLQRIHYLLGRVFDLLDMYKPRVVCIEGYSFGSTQRKVEDEGNTKLIREQGHADRIELGGVLRMDLWCSDYVQKIHEVPPASLKKFVAKGNASKEEVVAAVLDRWNLGLGSHDEYDAMIAARIAGCIAGLREPEDQRQREVLKSVTNSSKWLQSQSQSQEEEEIPF